ncbi:MAG: dienelactone hydrolase family protein [Rhodobacteraceae bacterium]|nr:dienelactone hydrolase family protein [Paracoccaceae bacterium]
MKSLAHSYTDGHDTFIGRLVWNDTRAIPGPGILVAPAFGGLGPFEEERAQELAEAGYVVLAVDYYGDGKRATSKEDAFAMMGELNSDRSLLARRMIAALNELKRQKSVDSERIGAMGYCLGGKAVLDLARTGEKFEACVSLHGVYDAPPNSVSSIVPSLLILHGWEDPLATPDNFVSLASELTSKCQDWQMLSFGHTGHAFTNPNAQEPDEGMAYSQRATRRSWNALTDFFHEKLGN